MLLCVLPDLDGFLSHLGKYPVTSCTETEKLPRTFRSLGVFKNVNLTVDEVPSLSQKGTYKTSSFFERRLTFSNSYTTN